VFENGGLYQVKIFHAKDAQATLSSLPGWKSAHPLREAQGGEGGAGRLCKPALHPWWRNIKLNVMLCQI